MKICLVKYLITDNSTSELYTDKPSSTSMCLIKSTERQLVYHPEN